MDVKSTSQTDFMHARWRALLRDLRLRLRGQSNSLVPYDSIKEELHAGPPNYRGHQEVRIDQIAGSVNRYRDFDRAFLPRQTFTRERWQRISEARYKEINLPPVELYKVGDAYFVIDGNHRISVARQRGQVYIDAIVYEARVRVKLRPDIKMEDIDAVKAKLDFVEWTGIDELCPDVDIDLTIPEAYYRLMDHIETHRYLQGQEWEREFTRQEAVTQWVEQVYLPTVHVIREANILKDFPGRTEADLYLWTIEHLYYLQERYGERVSMWDAARDFAAHFTPKPFKRAWAWLLDRLRGGQAGKATRMNNP
jgi:hypothetical protein